MKVTELQFDPQSILGPADQQGLVRSKGTLHLSTIYNHLDKTLNPPKNKMEEEQLRVYMACGFLWEQVIASAMAKSLEDQYTIRPGEYEKDGIVGSPDLIRFQDPITVIDTKATFRSMDKLSALEKFFWVWIVQLKSYCWMVETGTAELMILFICGNWKPPIPALKRLRLEFTMQELRDNWRMILQHYELMKKKGLVK